MSRKMFAWSMRLRMRLTVGPQLKRWYTAEVPNSSSEDAKKTALDAFATVPSARVTRMMPSAIATGKVAAWIQPRQVGRSSTSEGRGCSRLGLSVLGLSVAAITKSV